MFEKILSHPNVLFVATSCSQWTHYTHTLQCYMICEQQMPIIIKKNGFVHIFIDCVIISVLGYLWGSWDRRHKEGKKNTPLETANMSSEREWVKPYFLRTIAVAIQSSQWKTIQLKGLRMKKAEKDFFRKPLPAIYKSRPLL